MKPTYLAIKRKSNWIVLSDAKPREGDMIYQSLLDDYSGRVLICQQKDMLPHVPLADMPWDDAVVTSKQKFSAGKSANKKFQAVWEASYNKAKEKYEFTEQDMIKCWTASDNSTLGNLLKSIRTAKKYIVEFEMDENEFRIRHGKLVIKTWKELNEQ